MPLRPDVAVLVAIAGVAGLALTVAAAWLGLLLRRQRWRATTPS
jgi:uncharacterized protein involved in exopolysaccharide biosynthesis